MAKGNGGGMQICPTCNGKGFVMRPKLRVDKNNKGRTEQTQEVCPRCNWVGWIPRD